MAMDHANIPGLQRCRAVENMAEQRPPGERLQDLGQVRAHARALARCENDRGKPQAVQLLDSWTGNDT